MISIDVVPSTTEDSRSRGRHRKGVIRMNRTKSKLRKAPIVDIRTGQASTEKPNKEKHGPQHQYCLLFCLLECRRPDLHGSQGEERRSDDGEDSIGVALDDSWDDWNRSSRIDLNRSIVLQAGSGYHPRCQRRQDNGMQCGA